MEEMAERLTQTEQLVTQLKEMIREKDAALCKKDDQLKVWSLLVSNSKHSDFCEVSLLWGKILVMSVHL